MNRKLWANVLTALMLPKIIFADAARLPERDFASELDAVTAAVNYYNPLSIRENREYMGTIYRHGDSFRFSVTAAKKTSDGLAIRLSGDSLLHTVALWHTHGGQKERYRFFSDVDTHTASRTRLPFYLADYTGYLKIYRPGDSTLSPFQARKLGLDFNRGYATGSQVNDEDNRPVLIETRG